MNGINRVVLIVLDSVGVGSLPDAAEYGDEGANTLGHVAEAAGGLNLPHLRNSGWGTSSRSGASPPSRPAGLLRPHGRGPRGKDTLAGHWELMGIVLEKPFALFPGVPGRADRRVRGPRRSRRHSGQQGRFGHGDHRRTRGRTCAHRLAHRLYLGRQRVPDRRPRGSHPLARLYEMCLEARRSATLGGSAGSSPGLSSGFRSFSRTANRRDFSMAPRRNGAGSPEREGWPSPPSARSKISSPARASAVPAQPRQRRGHGLLAEELAAARRGLIFANLVDFDMLYGHRNDADGYGAALEAFDRELGRLLAGSAPATC